MLLRFSVSNFLSVRDPQELSLVASTLKDSDAGLISSPALPNQSILPIAIIYGANASGKSNLVSALRFMRDAVLSSHSQGQPDSEIPRAPFALDPKCKERVSSFNIDFVTDGTRYHYGFEASDVAFVSEWLVSFPKGRRQMLFSRDNQEFTFGRTLRGRNRVISELTRPNSLFVSAAAQNDHEELSKIARYFRSIRTDFDISIPGGVVSMRLAQDELDSRVIEFLSNIGTGVVSSRKREEPIPEKMQVLRKEIFDVVRRLSGDSAIIEDQDKEIMVELAHRGSDGKEVFFKLDQESAGTRRLLLLLGPAFKALQNGTTLVVEELDASLHTQACEAILALFSSPKTNRKGAQLIATTHDTNLLTSRWLRRDQVWFMEKDPEGATHLYPLTDIRTRRADNLEKGYLEGRYGAIPFAGPISELVGAE